MAYMRLGDLLVSSGIITGEQLEQALALPREDGQRLGDVLIRQGVISEAQLIDALRVQLGVDFVDLTAVSIPVELAKYVPRNLAKKFLVVPVKLVQDRLYLAMHDPLDFVAQDEVKTASRKRIIPMIATRKAVEQVGGDIRVCEKQIASCEAEQSKAVETAAQSREAAEGFFAQHPLLEPLAQERKKGLMTGGRTARAAAQTAEKAQTRLDDALRAYLTSTLEPAQRDYNEHYVCDYPLGLAGVEQYRAQHDSLVRIDLERYAARLEQAQRDCKDRFRKDILFRMKDDIFNARRQFRELNKVMEQLTYGEEVYRFELEPSRDPQLAAFYQVIVDKGNQQMTDGDSLDNLAATADPVYERQVDALMEKIMADVDENTRARQEGRTTSGATLSDYVDYRTYLDYDIKVTNTVSGQQAYLSRVSRDSSGGENQAPFYVAICASLLQIYQKSENSIRLVLLDEAFSKMTSDRIRPMMELFRRLQLQVLLISTVEKSTAIQPYCDITYSIVRHGDANAIAPFYRAGTLADALEKETEYE